MAETTATSQSELLRLLVSQLSEFVIVLLDTNGHFTSWHPGVKQGFEYDAEEFIGEHLDLLLPAPDRLSGVSERELATAAKEGRASDTRWLAKKGGQQVLVEGVIVGLRDSTGKLAAFGKVLRDVTERKKSDEQLRVLAGALEESPVFIRSWDGLIEHWTAGCERLYGWPAKEAVGRSASELLQTTHPQSLEHIKETLLTSGVWQGELGQIKRDGTPVIVSASWVLLSDRGGEHRSIIATHTDITARLQMQQELEAVNERLKRMAAELERSNEELAEFASIASHDLSAPLTSTRWLVDLLSIRHGSQLNTEGQKCLTQISQGLQRMAALVEAVLAHALAGRTAIGSSEATDCTLALRAAEENLQKDIETSGASINHEYLPKVYVEPQPLNQLFQNLLSNAIKYRRPDSPPGIRITAERQGSMWRMGVHDNGIGIEPAWLERVFVPLQRCHGMEIPGSGIGLATCKKIVTRAGGRIWVESEGSGSSFFFTLPGPEMPTEEPAAEHQSTAS